MIATSEGESDLNDPTLSALQRLSLERRASTRPDGNRNVAKGIRGLHFGGRAGLAKKNLASMAPDGLPGTIERQDGWNGFDASRIDEMVPKGVKRPAQGLLGEKQGVEETMGSRPSKLAALAANRAMNTKSTSVAPASSIPSNPSDGKPLSKLQQKMQANLLARQQKKHSTVSREDEALAAAKSHEEELLRASLLPTGDSVASLFPVVDTSPASSAAEDEQNLLRRVLIPCSVKDLPVPGGNPLQGCDNLEAFIKPSPDDVILRAREGTKLVKS